MSKQFFLFLLLGFFGTLAACNFEMVNNVIALTPIPENTKSVTTFTEPTDTRIPATVPSHEVTLAHTQQVIKPEETPTPEREQICEGPFEFENTGYKLYRDKSCRKLIAERANVKYAAELDIGDDVPNSLILTNEYWVDIMRGNFVKREEDLQGIVGDAYLRMMAIMSLRQQVKYSNTIEDYRKEYERIKLEYRNKGRIDGIYFTNPSGNSFELKGQPLIVVMEEFSFNNSGGWEARGSGTVMGFTYNVSVRDNSVIIRILTAPDGLNDVFKGSTLEGQEVGRTLSEGELRQLYSQKLFANNLIRTLQLMVGMSWAEAMDTDWHLRPETVFLSEALDPGLIEHMNGFYDEYLPRARSAVQTKNYEELSKLVGRGTAYPYSYRNILLKYMSKSLFKVENFNPETLR